MVCEDTDVHHWTFSPPSTGFLVLEDPRVTVTWPEPHKESGFLWIWSWLQHRTQRTLVNRGPVATRNRFLRFLRNAAKSWIWILFVILKQTGKVLKTLDVKINVAVKVVFLFLNCPGLTGSFLNMLQKHWNTETTEIWRRSNVQSRSSFRLKTIYSLYFGIFPPPRKWKLFFHRPFISSSICLQTPRRLWVSGCVLGSLHVSLHCWSRS